MEGTAAIEHQGPTQMIIQTVNNSKQQLSLHLWACGNTVSPYVGVTQNQLGGGSNQCTVASAPGAQGRG